MTTLATIGYEGSSLEDFIATLLAANITTLVDVREVPASRKKGFSKNALREVLEDVGMTYVHLVGLGDPKEGRDAAREGRSDDFLKIYTAHMKTPVAQADLKEAAEITGAGGVCLMCYERDYKDCHRKLVADALSDILGATVRHLGVPKGIGKNDHSSKSRTSSHARQGVAACG